VAVVADVDADARELRLERRVTEVAGLEVVLLPEAGRDLRDVVLPVLAEVAAVGVDDGGGVVVDAVHLALVDGQHDRHAVLLGEVLELLVVGPSGTRLGEVVPLGRLLGAEVGAVEQLLEAEDLHALLRGLLGEAHRLLDLGVVDGFEAGGAVELETGLHEARLDDTRHEGISGSGWLGRPERGVRPAAGAGRHSTATRRRGPASARANPRFRGPCYDAR
jgi:hypothetical protein